MLLGEAGGDTSLDLERNIKCAIKKRTAGQIRNLSVDKAADGLTITGTVSSYYLKQLALHGVRDAIGDNLRICINLKIDVVPSGTRTDCN